MPRAYSPTSRRLSAGFALLMSHISKMSKAWHNRIQDRYCPNIRCSKGIRNWSTSGAQIQLIE